MAFAKAYQVPHTKRALVLTISSENQWMSDCATPRSRTLSRILAWIRNRGGTYRSVSMGYRIRSPSAANDIVGGIGLVWLVGSLLLAALDLSNAVAVETIPESDD